MANRKYVRVSAKELPDVFYLNDDSGNVYFARYRVVSEDGRIASDWSQKFELPTEVRGTDIVLVNSQQSKEWEAKVTSDVLDITWNVNRLFNNKKLFVNRFHVYVKFDDNSSNNPWRFMGETTTTKFSTIMPSGMNKATVAVLVPTYRGLDAEIESIQSPADLFPESVLFLAEAQ